MTKKGEELDDKKETDIHTWTTNMFDSVGRFVTHTWVPPVVSANGVSEP